MITLLDTLAVFDFGTAFSNLIMPGFQAAATIRILRHQKKQYEEVAEKRIELMEEAVDNYCTAMDACIASGMFRDGFGKVPRAILFQPVNIDSESVATINGNLRRMPDYQRQLEAVNCINTKADITRMIALDPMYLSNIQMQSVQIKDLLAGKLPIDEVVEIMTDVAEQACFMGRIGCVSANLARNLGISRIRAQASGREAFERHTNQLNRDVSPISRQANIMDFLQTAPQRIALALTQAQLIQQSLQNAANADAAGDPTVYAELQVKLQKINMALGVESNRGNMVNQFVPNYAAILQPQIQSLTGALSWGADDATKRPDRASPSAATEPTSPDPVGKKVDYSK